MPCEFPCPLTQKPTLRFADLLETKRCRQLVGLVKNYQVPVGRRELELEIVITGELVQTCDKKILLSERVARARRFDAVPRE